MSAAVLYALGAATSFALAAVLQQEAAQDAAAEASLRLRLLLGLLRQPKWLFGIAMLLLGFALQALALANGPVSLVQPIVATELAFAIPVAIWRRRRAAGMREWIGIACVLGGVSAFLAVASPESGTAQPGTLTWVLSLAPVGALIAAAVALGAAARGPGRASLLGAAAGLAFGLLAVLTKSVTRRLSIGVAQTFTSWEIYLLVVVGVFALVLSQSAYQAGPLALSMPMISVLEPIVAVVIGETALDEQARLAGWALAGEGLAAFVACAGIVTLATSPLVLGAYGERARPPGQAPAASEHRAGGRDNVEGAGA